MKQSVRFGAVAMALATLPAQGDPARVFTPADILEWEVHAFADETRYELVETDQGKAIHAQCEGNSASGLYHRKTVNLNETPIIEWRWRVEDPVNPEDETSQSGDDYAARLYAVDEHTFLRWRTRAVNYVWASQQPVGSDWENAYQSRAQMVAVQSGAPEGGEDDDGWRTQRRNLKKDFQRFHDRDLDEVSVIAIMTDCDDTGEPVEAWYGEIRFLPADAG
ncbi:hypothetical protein DES49_1305 [Halospina denitrificans]|uniref:DUF3047 family protein n=1 Tax=Halospina denitrificans TaxID=332522 RepID=A0A4R7K0L4_9GAMM|nr:DUF3047 domain-containing protein [Halospina denitrificans]TDT43487.1 hypothetical protein DES49_1305 [Halospina denitrificans]